MVDPRKLVIFLPVISNQIVVTRIVGPMEKAALHLINFSFLLNNQTVKMIYLPLLFSSFLFPSPLPNIVLGFRECRIGREIDKNVMTFKVTENFLAIGTDLNSLN